uniref:Progestin and adipoQ receptor family member VI variant 4 n=1 Tax=Homo sapiens TaxID=9606 RepID=K9J974_HUMAN|nr:progestin and adipoQ receptor family member VI variant 4 [Homo sapiens]
MSPRMRHICYFLDYGALSLYSLVLCACRRTQLLPVHRPLLLLPFPGAGKPWAQ